MKFTKFGKALLMSALSVGVVLGITSCVQSYTVGYLYVTGTVTSQSTGNGIISGFKIDHNTGNLVPIAGLPISSGGANPGRAVLLTGGRFIYVLNQGVNAEGGSTCTTADPCTQSNITQFAIGGNGILSSQETFFTQGINPFRIFSDTSGNYLYVLDHDSPATTSTPSNPVASTTATPNPSCGLTLGAGVVSCGDITVFQINPTTGRLTLVVNSQVTSASGSPLSYFPVPANPIDFALATGFVLTMSGTPATGDSVFPYTYNSSSGQLTVNQNSSQPLNTSNATAIVSTTYVYVLSNDPVTIGAGATFPAGTYPSEVLPFTVGTNGALQQQTGGAVPGEATLTNPIYLIAVSSKWTYVAYEGNNNTTSGNTQSGIGGYVDDPATHQLTPMAGSPFGSGAGPVCMLEDPSNQFIYTANMNDSTVTGRLLDQNAGTLDNLSGKANRSFPLTGPAAWCMVTGRTS
jgi:6-phosphogluconolactonase (cycloisomerase 2 family)